ncbi:D-beta-hydroxybutyrate dehydrogenase, mitochondrial [Galleria mellonella]|uniref:D-beta-hydroxybutyrate dehydrogenase, mitochondrial n=1 Tax=Galleria mellonella TaxID=7137 RepID=A0A6J1WH37_GALME|nr:D-beta-hydroxybutyrate dehydrogenase, mitochondrial [Galleria mellonella]XP_052759386.1 D-beta-hydroxybutyrate dehydrogenase, mitochondrial [Galleria mellonella]
MSLKRVVAITGCDSGLGWAIAARSAREGLITVAGMYKGTETKAAQALMKLKVHPFALDVTDTKSVTVFRDYVMSLLAENPNYNLHAIVNNAGVMTVGDYEWQTPKNIENTINVNLLGAMRVVTAFLPDLRRIALDKQSNPRIINVASHCGLHPLPGFGVYSASKAGLLAWTRSLRFEHRLYGLNVVAFIPGGFIGSSNIMANQTSQGNAMLEQLNEEQKLFYGKRIEALTNYLGAAGQNTNFDSLNDEKIIETFIKALIDEVPKDLYIVESWRYMFYYNLLKLPLPEAFHHWLIKQFLSFPEK